MRIWKKCHRRADAQKRVVELKSKIRIVDQKSMWGMQEEMQKAEYKQTCSKMD